MEYYYVSPENKAEGPVSLEQLRALLSTGRINASTKVAAVGTQEWIPIIRVIPELASAAATPVFPPPSGPAAPPVVIMSQGGQDPLAIISMILSIVGLCICCYGLPFSIAGVICGHISFFRFKQNPLLQGRGMAVAGLWVGYIAIAIGILAVIGIFLSSFIDGYKKARYGH